MRERGGERDRERERGGEGRQVGEVLGWER